MKLAARDLELLSGAECPSRTRLHALRLTGVSTDSRSVGRGSVFVALKGEIFDGHAFIADAVKAGASVVIVDAAYPIPASLRKKAVFVRVPDTTKALGDLALLHRMKFDIPVVAVGGSNGKTTTKEMIASVLRERYTVLATEGNLNNHIGVPQMLFRLAPRHEIAVVELGTNHFGELQYLCSLALPTHAVITNIGREHLEFFGTLEGVAEEETELFRFMNAASGCAFVNLDDPVLAEAGRGIERAVTFGSAARADVRAAGIELDEKGRASFSCTVNGKTMKARIRLGASGVHNVSNALAAIAVGVSFGVPMRSIARALAGFKPASKRMEIFTSARGVTVLNDTYNANPDSMHAALSTLWAMGAQGKKIAVLGDMFELGARAGDEHRAVGSMARTMAPDVLVTVGALARLINESARLRVSRHCETKAEALAYLQSVVQPGDAVLVKGSRGMKMEEIAQQL